MRIVRLMAIASLVPARPSAARTILIVLACAFAVSTAFAQPKAPAFREPGEPVNLVVRFQPYYVVTWTAAIAHNKDCWRKHLPAGSRVELNVAIRGPALAAAIRDGKLHISYIGDAAVPLAAAKEPDIRLLAVAALSQDQCIVVARRAPPELVILDLMMPEVSGFEVARALRESEHTARIPIVVLTAKDLSAEDHARLNGGVSAILAKASFSTSELLAELRRALPKRGGD